MKIINGDTDFEIFINMLILFDTPYEVKEYPAEKYTLGGVEHTSKPCTEVSTVGCNQERKLCYYFESKENGHRLRGRLEPVIF